MGRRSILVALAAIATALVPVTAQAATAPTDVTVSPATGVPGTQVTISWNTALEIGPVTQQLYRAQGLCASITIPVVGATAINPTPAPPVLGGPSSMTDTPPLGSWCYYVQADDDPPAAAVYSAGDDVVIAPPPDTTPPTANPPGVAFPGNAPYVRGTVTVTLSSSDAGSPPTTNSLRIGGATCDASSTPIASPWDTLQVLPGTYLLCNVATDSAPAHNVGVSTAVTVVVDNTAPVGGIITPGAGAFVSGGQGNPVALQVSASDATAGIRGVQWQRSATGAVGGAWPNIQGEVTNAANGYQRNWNPAGAGDGPDYLRAVITDNAGNQLITPVIPVTVDNTPPDAASDLTGPPAVAGSPTLSWTPAHDAIGILRYEVLRGATVIGTRSSNGALSYSFTDVNAPDRATSNYTVRAYDNTGHFIDSDSVAVLVDSQAQSAPRTLAAPTPTAIAPALSWQAPIAFGVDHYDVYRDGQLLASTTGPATTYTDGTAVEGEHDYAVLARSAASQPGVLSSSFTVLLDTTPPTSGGAPTAQVMPAGSVDLVWPAAGDALSGVAGYVVRRATGGIPPAAADGGTAVCAPTSTDCSDVATTSGTWSYGVFARDIAGNVALIGTVAGVVINDKTAPLAPTKLSLVRPKAKKPTANIAFTLRWVKPLAADLDRVVVVLNLKRAPRQPADGRAIYKGLGSSAKFTLRAGQTGYLALYAYDHTGNVSAAPARTVVKLASLIPLRPLTGSVVRTATPMLTWKAKQGTAYYNVQLFVNGKRVLVGWPAKAKFRVPAGKLLPGTYVWYVWPAIKHKGKPPTFGKLIGRATFTFKK
jgi:hypothetical protein